MTEGMHLRHIGIVVKDLELCKAFWLNGFSMEVTWDEIEEGSYIDALFSKKDTRVRTVKMRDKSGFAVELLQLLSDRKQSGLYGEPSDFGLRHIALSVDCLKTKLKHLCQGGNYPEPKLVQTPDKKHTLCYFRGPEGLILELVQED